MSAPRLSKKIKQAIIEAYCDGESATAIAKRFDVNRSYPRLLFRRRIAAGYKLERAAPASAEERA